MNENANGQETEPTPYADNPGAYAEMPRYQSHKKVWALKIAAIEIHGDGSATISPADPGYGPFRAGPKWAKRFDGSTDDPGYYVVYEDGFTSWSPTKAFEGGYRRIESLPPGLRGPRKMLERSRLEICDELDRARTKFPMPNPTFVALTEEVGELAKALLECNPIKDDYPLHCRSVYKEAVQVAAMAIRVMEEGDRDFPAYATHLGMGDNWPNDQSARSSQT